MKVQYNNNIKTIEKLISGDGVIISHDEMKCTIELNGDIVVLHRNDTLSKDKWGYGIRRYVPGLDY